MEAFLELREVFGADLPAERRFRAAVAEALDALLTKGAARIVANFQA
jgi:mannitol-1-phosphate/altronate dehydrogenase